MIKPVSVAPCKSYDPTVCRAALERALAPLGGLDWVQPAMKIGIKANLVSLLRPEAAATTHPALLRALCDMLTERGADVTIGDSPGGIYNAVYVSRVYAATGMTALEGNHVSLNRDFSQKNAVFPEGAMLRSFAYTGWLDGMDEIINFSKLKTHGMMGLSCAVKNLFGAIPGTMKPEYHYRFPNQDDFAAMLLDLGAYFHPRLSIADAVVGMEGNGPTMGSPREIGCILASADASALDLAAAELIGLSPDAVPTLRLAQKQGLAPAHTADLEIVGPLSDFRIADYKNIGTKNGIAFLTDLGGKDNSLLAGFLRAALQSVPAPTKKACVGCEKCKNICPAKAISMVGGIPRIDRKTCIRCFCCQEFCPVGAMRVRRPMAARLLGRV